VLSAIVAVLLGVGIGWLGFGRATGGHAMTDAQRATLVQLDSSNEFDPGSIEFVGAKHGVEAWYATKDLDENECLVLVADETAAGAEDAQTTACQKTGASDTFGLQTNLELTVDGERVMIWAVLLDDTDGDRVTVIQREVLADAGTYDWRSQYSGPELDIAEFLDASGYDGDSLQLIGWDDTTPVWMTFDGSEVCMLVAEPTALIGEACAEFDSAVGSRIEMSTARGVYQLNLTQNVDPRLTIIRTPDSIICDMTPGTAASTTRQGRPAADPMRPRGQTRSARIAIRPAAVRVRIRVAAFDPFRLSFFRNAAGSMSIPRFLISRRPMSLARSA